MTHAYIGLGSNIEPREDHLSAAIQLLGENKTITVDQQSAVYQTKPVGYTEQADFLNMVVQITTSLSALTLLDACQSIEQELGRRRGIRFGPRTIDLDILWYDNQKIETERLTVPHSRMHERAFVLIPFSEIAPDVMIPGYNQCVDTLAQSLPPKERQGVRKWKNSPGRESEQ